MLKQYLAEATSPYTGEPWTNSSLTLIDVHRATPSQLMAIGGWENEQTVKNPDYKTGKEHTDSGLALLG
jgi:hypothetical protein